MSLAAATAIGGELPSLNSLQTGGLLTSPIQVALLIVVVVVLSRLETERVHGGGYVRAGPTDLYWSSLPSRSIPDDGDDGGSESPSEQGEPTAADRTWRNMTVCGQDGRSDGRGAACVSCP